jgi:hypothetical protein
VGVLALDIDNREVNSVEGYPDKSADAARNHVWSDIILKALANQVYVLNRDSKIVMLGGTAHLCGEENVISLLRANGTATTSAEIVAGDPTNLTRDETLLVEETMRAGLGESRFMVHGIKGFDHDNVIYVPSGFAERIAGEIRERGTTVHRITAHLASISNPELYPRLIEQMADIIEDPKVESDKKATVIRAMGVVRSEDWEKVLKKAAQTGDDKLREAAQDGLKLYRDFG